MKKGKQVSLQEALSAPDNTVFLSKYDGYAPVRVNDGKLVYHFSDIAFSGETIYGILPFITIGEVVMKDENNDGE